MIIHDKLSLPYEKIKWKDNVPVRCDYCGEEVEKSKKKIQKGRKFIEKDSCSKDACTKKKLADVNLFRYGVVNSFQRKDVKESIKKTNLERHGVEHAQQSESIRAKSRATCLANHGVEHALQNRELLIRAQATSLERYGSKFPIQLDKFKKKVQKTNLELYGVENFLSSSDVKERIKRTNIKRYGTEYPAKSPEIRNKIDNSNLEKYGCKNPFSSKEIIEKIRSSNIAKYGTPFPIKKFGKTQETIRSWINSHGFNFKSNYDILQGKELDLYDSCQKLALEYCGLYWHNEDSPKPRTRSYHHDKWRRCRDKGIQLLTIFDDEWRDKKEVCRSLILSKLGLFQTRIQARRCEVREITKKEMSRFCDLHHLQGANKLGLVCFGLFHEDEMVGAVDLGRHHRKKDKATMVLTRLCFKCGTQVVGGAGKLFKACVGWCRENNINTIVSWSDNRYSDGTIYEKLGFDRKEDLPPDYYYVNMKNPKTRISKQSQGKRNSKCPKGMTELEWANSRGLSRIWDCGKTRWEICVR